MFWTDWTLAATGLGIGLAVAAPIGPVNVIVIHTAVRKGFLAGLAAGAGAVLADTIFAAIAAFGITAISDFLEGHVTAFRIVGGLLLLGFGLRMFRSRPLPVEGPIEDTARSRLGAAASCFFLTVTNPALMFGLAAIFGGLGRIGEEPEDYAAAAILVAGVASGSLLWWISMSALVSRVRGRITQWWLSLINHVFGAVLAVLGMAVLAATVLGF